MLDTDVDSFSNNDLSDELDFVMFGHFQKFRVEVDRLSEVQKLVNYWTHIFVGQYFSVCFLSGIPHWEDKKRTAAYYTKRNYVSQIDLRLSTFA